RTACGRDAAAAAETTSTAPPSRRTTAGTATTTTRPSTCPSPWDAGGSILGGGLAQCLQRGQHRLHFAFDPEQLALQRIALLGLLEHRDQLPGITRRVEAHALDQQLAFAIEQLEIEAAILLAILLEQRQ